MSNCPDILNVSLPWRVEIRERQDNIFRGVPDYFIDLTEE